MIYLQYFLIFMLGASIASYICAYLYRLDNPSLTSNRSKCESCNNIISWYENIPIFSYLFLFGKCKNCKAKIKLRYFVGEISLALWFLFSFANFSNIYFFILQLLLGSLLLYISLEDFEKQEVSSRFLYAIVSVSIFTALLKYIYFENLNDFIFGFLISLPFWIIYFISRGKWIGIADPYLFTSINIFFGTQFAISLFLYSAWFGVLFALFFLKINKSKHIPFVPVIFFSTLFILISNFNIIRIQDILTINEILSIYTY